MNTYTTATIARIVIISVLVASALTATGCMTRRSMLSYATHEQRCEKLLAVDVDRIVLAVEEQLVPRGFVRDADEQALIQRSRDDASALLVVSALFVPKPSPGSSTGTFVTLGVRKTDGCPMALVRSTVWPFSIPYNREIASTVEMAMREATPGYETAVDVELGWSGLR